MRWPWLSNDDDKEKDDRRASTEQLLPKSWQNAYTEPSILLPALGFTVATFTAVRFYKSYLRRIPTVNHIKPDFFRRRSLFGRVTSVGDADNFRLYHTPGGRLAGWGWLPWKRVPNKREGLMKQTVSLANGTLWQLGRENRPILIAKNL